MNSIIAPSFLPASAVLELTYACNNSCLFCSCPWEYAASGYEKHKELSLEEWKTCIKSLIDMGVCNISYTGGEPFMNKNLRSIIEFTSSLKARHINGNLEIEEKAPNQFLISNGQLLTGETLLFLKEHKVNLSISLPGLKTYNEHTKNGDYRKVMELFSQSKEIGLSTTVNITVTKKNLFELYETLSNALIAGAGTLILNRFMPGGRGMTHANELLLDKSDTISMLQIADEVLTKAGRFGSTGTEIPICLLKNLKFTNLRVGTRCSAAIEFFVIGPDGWVRTCNHSAKQLTHFTNIESLPQNDYWKLFTQKSYLPSMCNDCSLTGKCDGGCREAAYMVNGRIDGPDPIFN